MRTLPESSGPQTSRGGDFFATSLEHVLAELERIDYLIRLQAVRARRLHATDPELQGLYIAEQEADELLATPAGLPRWAAAGKHGWPPEVRDALAKLGESTEQRARESARRGLESRLDRLRRLFALSALDFDALLIALAPELDLRYERLFGYLQDDVTKKRPSVDLVLNLLCPSLEQKLAAWSSFSARAPLLRHRLVQLFDDPSRPHPPLLAKYLRADGRIVSYLFDSNDVDARLEPHAGVIQPAARLLDLVLPADIKGQLQSLASAGPGRRQAILLHGADGVGRKTAAEALCREWGLKLLELEIEPLLAADASGFTSFVELAGREASLQGAALYWRGFDSLRVDEQQARLALFLRLQAKREGVTFLAGQAAWEPANALHGVDFLRYELLLPGHRERLELWSRTLADTCDGAVDADGLATVADRFRLTGGQIRDAAATARSLARRRSADGEHVSVDDLHAACRLQSNRKLGELAQKITPGHRWQDIVLPRDRMEQLRELCDHVEYRGRVYGEWGFDRKLSRGKGLCALFTGPSGTGKTMAAEIVAGELGLDLYRIDLSTVVSKWVGETEKNLARIFAEAETSNAILFFDEADALFGKRSAVKDAHDRYANIEISYLLQRMEEYEGVSILATNLRQSMDEAFVRRMAFMVRFPFPGEQDRRQIWERIWPPEVPRNRDLDLAFMARQFKLAGGNIKNIAVAAAFLAAADGQIVTMSHLGSATRRELEKMGKTVGAGDLEMVSRLPRYEVRNGFT